MAASMGKTMAAVFNMKCFIFTLTLFIAIIAVSDGARLSDPKILLPYHSSVTINFTLNINLTKDEVRSPGCYTWRSSRLDVATVQLINKTDNECALSAEISAVSKSSVRKTSIVIAENKVTGELLKCIVIVDTLQRIEIETTTRLLYLEDSPEELIVRGYDAEGNVFSSLRGLEFQWSLHSDNSGDEEVVVDANSILRITKFIESHYTTPYHIDKLEDRGRQGDVILVEGVRTGSAIVWAKLRDPAYESVSHSSVRLMVIANLMVSPPEAYVLKYATVKYTVEQIRQNSVVAIKMPSPQFYLEVVNSMISSLDAASSVATALELGETEIKLIDKNIKTSDVLGQPSAILHVVSPSYLGFVVLPGRKWVLETGHVYEVLIEVYDKNSHKLYASDNVIIDALFPRQYFNVHFSSKNGTYHVVETLLKGDTDIEGSLATVIRGDGSSVDINPALKQAQFVEIYDPITVQPSAVYFPWDTEKQTTHRYQLKAKGGSGEYVWSSDSSEIVTVNKFGEITTSARGEAVVTAADKRNQLHKGVTKVHVLPPSDMQFLPNAVEIQVGRVLDIPLDVMAMYGGQKFSFNDCRNMPLNVTFSDPSVVQYVEGYSSLKEGSCRTIKVKGVQQGHTKVMAIYNHGRIKLESSVTIAAYDPLVPVDPEKEAVVTIGASKELIFAGGPQPWVLDSSKYFQDMTAGQSKNVLIHQVENLGAQKRQHSFFVTCKKFGEQMMILRVGNEKTAKNQHPAVEEASVSFVCAEPVEIHLEPQIEYPRDLPPCPVAREPNLPIPVHCRRDLNLGVSVTDKNGRRFDNVSSLEFEWSLSDTSLATFPNRAELESDVTVTSSNRRSTSTYVTIHPEGVADSLVITAAVSGYKKNYLKLATSNINETITPKISKSSELQLVEEAVISPSTLSVFNHPSNKVSVNIRRGSGYFHIVQDRQGVVDLKYVDKKKKIQVVPSQDGQLTVTVHDLCVYTHPPPSVPVTVSGVGSVQLYVMDKVEVGKDITARVQVLDVTGAKLFASFFPLMGLRLEPGSELVTLKPNPTVTSDEYTALFTVHGHMVGHTSLRAVTHLPDGRSVSSLPKPVEVFPPLELIPRNITLIIGAHFQVLSKGGPRPQSTVVFNIRNNKIATVSSSGLLDALSLGTTRVVGQAVGQDPETGETIIYSQDEVTVNVVRLVGIRIHAPLTRLQTGTTMPLYAVGMTEHETPFMFGSAVPALSFQWSVNKKDVAQLQSVFHKSGIQPQRQGNFAVQMVAQETGHVSVTLKVTPQKGYEQIVNDAVLTDELQIQVFPELAMVHPRVCDGQLLMTPDTEAVLKTNRDGGAEMTYRVMSPDDGRSPVVEVVDGVLVSGSVSGQAALHVTATEEFGISQTLVLHVKVKPVSYLMVNSDTSLRTSGGQLSSVPRGTTLRLTVTYHDDVGEQFYATNIEMKHRCNRNDLVQVSTELENNTLVMKTAAVGQTILKVWDSKKPWLVDFINIPVDNAIEPSNNAEDIPVESAQLHVRVGSVMCFISPITSDNGRSGVWSGTTGLTLDSERGIALASAVGMGTVSYVVSEYIATEMEVSVDAIKKVDLEITYEHVTLATDKNSMYHIYVSFGSHPVIQGNNCSALVAELHYQPKRMPFYCDLDFETPTQIATIKDLFSVKPVFISESGQYACQISPQMSQASQQISTMDVRLRASATVPSMKGQAEVLSTPLLVPFLPPLYIHNTEVHLSTLTPLSNVRVSTVPGLLYHTQVVVSDPSIIEATSPESDPQSKSIIIFPVRLLDTVGLWEREQLDVWVDLICQMTGQKVKIPVYIRLIGQKPDLAGYRLSKEAGWSALFSNILHNYQYWFILLIIIIVTALTVLFAYHAIFGPKYKMAAQNTSYMMPPGGSPAAAGLYPPGGSPGLYGSYYAPQTPKSPTLWSQGYMPVDGSSPTRRRSPIQRISPS